MIFTMIRTGVASSGQKRYWLSKGLLAIAISGVLAHGALAQDSDGTGSEASQDALEEITVTGIRGSLRRSQDIKRLADSAVEAVTFEDLGKFSDVSIADTLQRVPGVQVQRNDNGATDGGDRISIRGLGPQFVTTTINGRTPLSGGSEGITNLREFNFDIMPSEVTNGLLVYKSPESRLIENGLGGLVDVQTIRALDANYEDGKNFIGIVNARATYNDLSEDTGPRISGIGVFKNQAENLGGFVSVLYQDQEAYAEETFYRTLSGNIIIDTNQNGVNDSASGADEVYEDIAIINNITNNPIDSKEERTAFAAGLQFISDSGLEVNFDALYTEYNRPSRRDLFRHTFGAQGGIYDGIFSPGSVVVENGLLQNVDGSGLIDDADSLQIQTQELQYDNDQESLILGLNVAWENDDWRIAGDYSYSDLDYYNNTRSLGNFLARESGFGSGTANPEITSFVFDGSSATAGGVGFPAGDAWVTDPSSYGIGGRFVREFQNKSDRHAIRVDLENKFRENIVLKFGVRYETTDLDVRSALLSSVIPAGVTDDDIRNAAFGGLRDPFLGGVLPSAAVNVWRNIDGNAVIALIPDLGTLTAVGTSVFEDGNIVSAAENAPDGITPDADNFFQTDEDSLAGYVQLNYQGEWGNTPVSANFGVRVVQTEVATQAFSSVVIAGRGLDVDDIDGDGDTTEALAPVNVTFVPIYAESDDVLVLPSVNFNFGLRETTHLRVGIAKTVSRPTFVDQVPNNTIAINIENGQVTSAGGNGEVKPYTAWGLDLTLEHYTSNDGAIYASAFYKDVSDFIIISGEEDLRIAMPFDPADAEAVANIIQLGGEVPAGQSGLYLSDTVTFPINVSDAKVLGLELGFNQPLTFLSGIWSNFGITGNYTYIDSSFDEDVGDAGYGFPGSSQNNINFTAYYEVDRFSARLAYTYRDEYLRNLAGAGDRRDSAIFTEAQEQLNANMTFNVTENVSLTMAASNLTNEVRRDFSGVESNFYAYVNRPRTFVFGARVVF